MTIDLSYDNFGERRMNTGKLQVQLFLREFKEAATGKDGIIYVRRKKNMETLIELRITGSMRDSIVLGLTHRNYVSGPLKDDKGREGHLWIFGVLEDSKEIYIKLKVITRKIGKKAYCLSFHIAEYPLNYPMR